MISIRPSEATALPLDRVIEILKQVEWKHPISMFKPTLEVYKTTETEIHVRLAILVPHRESGDAIPIVMAGFWSQDFFDPEAVLKKLRLMMARLVLHELDESLFSGGLRYFDPHNEFRNEPEIDKFLEQRYSQL